MTHGYWQRASGDEEDSFLDGDNGSRLQFLRKMPTASV